MTEYAAIAERVARVARLLSEVDGFSETSSWAWIWAAGLFQLDDAAQASLPPHHRIRELARSTPVGTIRDPDALKDYGEARAADLVEQFQELAVLALSQPLFDSAARCWLERKREIGPGDRWWQQFMDHVDASGPLELRDLAREVDVTLRIGRDRLVAHPVSGHLAGRLRRPDGQVAHTSRIDLVGTGDRDRGFEVIRRLNSALPPEHRSTQENLWELARDLQSRARFLGRDQRNEFSRAAKLLGFEVDVRVGAAGLARLLEKLAERASAEIG